MTEYKIPSLKNLYFDNIEPIHKTINMVHNNHLHFIKIILIITLISPLVGCTQARINNNYLKEKISRDLQIGFGFHLSPNFEMRKLTYGNKLYSNIFLNDKLIKKLEEILFIQKGYFNVNLKSYSIILEHIPNKALKGTTIQNFILIQGDVLKNDYSTLKILSHELMHRYLGIILKQEAKNEISSKWFFEGFTEFYAIKTLLECKVIDENQYLQIVNETLVEYFNSPVIDINYYKLIKLHLEDYYIRINNYNKGFLIALITNEELRKISAGEKNLDNFINVLFKKSNNNNYYFNLRIYIESLKKFFPTQTSLALSRLTSSSIRDLLPSKIYKKALSRKLVQNYNLGFNLAKSIETQEIQGVRKDHEAYKKGLRNGQKLKGYSINYITGYVDIKIIKNDIVKSIKFNAYKEQHTVPFFE